MSGRRLVAVLGCSDGGTDLHEIGARRLRQAEVRAADVVLLSGWALVPAGAVALRAALGSVARQGNAAV